MIKWTPPSWLQVENEAILQVEIPVLGDDGDVRCASPNSALWF